MNSDEQGCLPTALQLLSVSASGRRHTNAFPRQKLMTGFSQSWSMCRRASGSNLELQTLLRKGNIRHKEMHSPALEQNI